MTKKIIVNLLFIVVFFALIVYSAPYNNNTSHAFLFGFACTGLVYYLWKLFDLI